MIRRAGVRAIFGAALLCAASAASAQFVQLSRCQSAMPCAIPFGLRYNPDPLSVAGFGKVPSTAFSMRLDPMKPFAPQVDLSRELDSQDWASQAAKIFVLRYPPKPRPAPEAAETAAPPPEKTRD